MNGAAARTNGKWGTITAYILSVGKRGQRHELGEAVKWNPDLDDWTPQFPSSHKAIEDKRQRPLPSLTSTCGLASVLQLGFMWLENAQTPHGAVELP